MLNDPDRESGRSLKFHRSLLFVAGAAYLIWWGCVELLLPGAFNPLGSRLAVVGFCFAAFGGSYASPWMARTIGYWLSAALWLITLHYFYLFYYNHSDINWVVGSYITIVAASSAFFTERALFAYAGFVVGLSCLLAATDPTLAKTVFLPGVLTILGFAYVTLRTRIRSERARVLYEAAQESIRMRDEFLSIASHELKTPLTNLKLQTEIAKRYLADPAQNFLTPANVARLVEQSDRQADRLTKLVEEMLDVSRVSAGKMRLAREEFDLGEIVREVVASFGDSFKQAGCAVEVAGAPARIFADRFRIEQVVANLLSNAMKYGQAKPVRIEIIGGAKETRLVVIDQGMGVAREDLDRIFRRFERAVSATRISGLGLGLFICNHIVTLHGGEIDVESEVGKGSRFTVRLPTRGLEAGG